MLRFRETEAAKTVYGAKKPINIWDVNVDNIVVSKLVETKANSKYLIEYLDSYKTPCEFVKIFKVKDGDKIKTINLYLCL